MKRKIIICIVLVLVILILAVAIYCCFGFSNEKINIEYYANIENTSSNQVEVKMIIKPTRKLFMHLYLRDTLIDGCERVKDIEVKTKDKVLGIWQTLPFLSDIKTVWLGFNTDPVEISYKVNPTTFKGDKQLGFIKKDYGYLRGMNVFFTPIVLGDLSSFIKKANIYDESLGKCKVDFKLPNGYSINSPIDTINDDFNISILRNIYFGLGDLSKSIELINGEQLSIAIHNSFTDGEKTYYVEAIKKLYKAMDELTGFTPIEITPVKAITILPHETTNGGAAGAGSLIAENNLCTIAHEMFHWWNGVTLETAKDANWLSEGFTTYYAGKLLLKVGVWDEWEFSDYIERLSREYVITTENKPISIINCSNRLVAGKGNKNDYTVVYNGGAMIADYIDSKASAIGQSLDAIWKELYEQGEPISSKSFINTVKNLLGRELIDECFEILKGNLALKGH